MATIYLIRHGQASFGADDYDKLSDLGRRQAEVTGHYLRDHDIHIDAAYSGTLLRQRETAQLALASQPGEVPHHIDARFNEVLRSSKDYQKVIDAVFNYWVSPECDEPEIQSWADYSGDVRSALTDVMREQGGGKTVAIFTSGGTIATAVSQVLGLDGTHAYKFYEPVFNCSVTQLFYSGDKVSLSYFNDRSFLQLMGRELGEELVSYR